MSTSAAPARFNFAPGPAQLPPEVVAQAAAAVRAHPPRGRSILELSHRSATFDAIAAGAEADLRALLDLPADYAVLFLNGGARLHYALWLSNFAAAGDRLGFVDTGHWSRLAIAAARRAGRDARVFAAPPGDYPDLAAADTEGLAYLHYVSNETLSGLAMPAPAAACPLVCDRTSDFLSAPFDMRPYALCYAGAQKNLGTAGLSVLVARRGLLRADSGLPPELSYAAQLAAGCRLHTPPVYPWFVCALTLRWLRAQGGLPEMARRAQARAAALYADIDASPLYRNELAPRARSRMNVCFRLPDPAREARFAAAAEAAGLLGLRGHPAVGGLRASLYNAMPEAGVDALREFMRDFERTA